MAPDAPRVSRFVDGAIGGKRFYRIGNVRRIGPLCYDRFEMYFTFYGRFHPQKQLTLI